MSNILSQLTSPYLFCDKDSINARKILLELDVTPTQDPTRADMIWARKGYKNYFTILDDTQLINHIPNESAMTDKGELALNLHRYAAISKNACPLDTFYPETYCLFNEEEREMLVSHYQSDESEHLWLLKPTTLSKGRGIKILRGTKDIIQYIINRKPIAGLEKQLERIPYIAQRYIDDMLLLDRKKSELRVYLFIACLKPLKVFVYPEGPVRLCAKPYSENEIDNALMHITNIYQQYKHPDFIPGTVLKWTFDQLNTEIYQRGLSSSTNAMQEEILPKIQAILKHIVKTALPSLTKVNRPALYFGVYGIDIILDNALNPWLTEVQIGPGLSFKDPVKKYFIFNMLQEAAEICFEIQNIKRQRLNPHQLNSIKKFLPIL